MTKRDWAERFRPAAGDAKPAEEAEAPAPAPRRRLPRMAAGLALALLLGFLVLRYSAVNALLELGPDAAAGLSRDHPQVLLDRAFEAVQLTGEPEAAIRADALSAFRRSPLSEVPMLIAARQAIAAGEEARADRLIAMASRRNPRSRYALLLELDQHIRLGRTAEAAAAMAVLTRSFPDAGRLLTVQLARMAAHPDTREAVRRAMAGDPQLTAAVLEQLARQEGVDPATIVSLAGDAPAVPAGGEAPAWQRLLIESMVERGEAREAEAVWLRLTGADPAGRAGGLYDRDFAGLPGPPPFNWLLETGGDGFAERTSNSLHVQYYGRRDVRLASQLLLLAPGRYRLSFAAEGEAEGGEGGRLAWIVSCHPGGRRLVDVPITGVDFSGKTIAAEFIVPHLCPAQWLRLIGNSAEFPEDQQVTIRQLRIAGAGLR